MVFQATRSTVAAPMRNRGAKIIILRVSGAISEILSRTICPQFAVLVAAPWCNRCGALCHHFSSWIDSPTAMTTCPPATILYIARMASSRVFVPRSPCIFLIHRLRSTSCFLCTRSEADLHRNCCIFSCARFSVYISCTFLCLVFRPLRGTTPRG